MAPGVFAIVVVSAALHASWNALVKMAGDKLVATLAVASAAGLLAAIALPFCPAPAIASYPYIAASAAIHVAYYLLIARAYHLGDLGQTYPLMRGLAPLIVAVVGTAVFGEALTTGAAIGVFLIGFGVLGTALGGRREQVKGSLYAVINAGVIAAYTLIDGFGARVSGAPVAYGLWCFVLAGGALGFWLCLRRSESLAALGSTGLWRPFLGGAATVLAYSLILWAMTVASIPAVAALRETAILFGAAISVLVLKENIRPIRMAAACVIAAGAVAIRIR